MEVPTVSCLAEPSSEEPFLPAQAASCSRCPLGWPPVPTLARARRRPGQGALALGSSPEAGQGLFVLGGAQSLAAAAPPGRGWRGPSRLSAQGSAPRGGTAPLPPPRPLRAASCPCLSPKPEKVSPVLGKEGSSWGPGPLDRMTSGWGWGEGLSVLLKILSPCHPPTQAEAPFPDSSFPTLFPHAPHTPSSS